MKISRYSAEQVAFALRQAESGTAVPKVWRKMGISEQNFCRWRKRKEIGSLDEQSKQNGEER